ncbi:MAG: response regulator [Candidatus Aureabacteria bacterium]|nr:response regulator [Candidatus Auribacterota bacterium]
MNIVLIDDDEQFVFIIKTRLESKGYHVCSGKTAHEGMRLSREEDPDIIILDIMLPDIDGFEVCSRLKEDPLTCDRPILMVSEKNTMRDRYSAAKVGAEDYLIKPFEFDDLIHKIENLIKKNHNIKTANRLNKVLVVDDAVTIRHILANFLKQIDSSVSVLEATDGESALALLEKEMPDLVLVDFNMPLMNGMDFVKKAKQKNKFRQIPIIMVTKENSSERIQEAFAAGVSGYLTKPFTQKSLVQAINRLTDGDS